MEKRFILSCWFLWALLLVGVTQTALSNTRSSIPIQTEIKSVQSISQTPVNTKATAETQKLYQLLVQNYGKKVLSGTMAEVAWNTKEADRVHALTGKYPAINGFDYLHLPYSGENWIDYTDISPIEEWSKKGGIVTILWHWNVPTHPLAADKVDIRACGTQRYRLSNDTILDILEEAEPGDKIYVRYEKASANAHAGIWASDNTTLKDGEGHSYGNFPIGGSRPKYGNVKCDATAFSFELDETMIEQLMNGFSLVGNGYTVTGVNYVKKETSEYSFNTEKTTFKMSRILTEGSIENKIMKADLDKIATCLLLLQEKKIPVLWRPLHEAAGGWFWWGGSTREDFIALWQYMYRDFCRRGINNLIWVWTPEQKTPAWYPGDEFVDIVGRDRYGVSSTTEMVDMFIALQRQYPNKIITLSECGTDPLITSQFSLGAEWSWFMPWYGNDESGVPHATDAWWQDAANSDKVLMLDGLK